MPVRVAGQPIHEKPIVRGVEDIATRAAERDRILDPLVVHAQAIVAFDGLHELPCGHHFLVAGQHLVAKAYRTIVVFRKPVVHGRNVETACETRRYDLVDGFLPGAASLDEDSRAGIIDRPPFRQIAARGRIGHIETEFMRRRDRGEQHAPQFLIEGIVEEIDVLPFDRIVLASDPVLVRQAQTVGPIEQLPGR